MAQQHAHDSKLERLSDTGLILADEHQDIRDRKVVDRHGKDIGHVADLFIDEQERKVRMLVIGAGGFLGLGERHFLLPVDAVTEVTKGEVHVNVTLERIVESPVYDPSLIAAPAQDAWAPYYGYYGFAPYWG
ncbi:MAG: PRC-barrel domain-containing protein, partial [Candidatus Eremiobacteraeota bacterium]|nr:PRC-barrel domain-containing protein [Candidatus Eremiobacteraeota bacterium]